MVGASDAVDSGLSGERHSVGEAGRSDSGQGAKAEECLVEEGDLPPAARALASSGRGRIRIGVLRRVEQDLGKQDVVGGEVASFGEDAAEALGGDAAEDEEQHAEGDLSGDEDAAELRRA